MSQLAPDLERPTADLEVLPLQQEHGVSDLPLAGTRVLYVSPQPFYEDRGSPIAVLQVLRAMSELGIHVDLLTFPRGRSVEVPNLRIFRCGSRLPIRRVPIGFSLRKVVLDVALMLAVRRRLREESYACVHALEDGIFVLLALKSARNLPIIYDMHSCIPEQLSKHILFRNPVAQWLLRKMERFAIGRATVVTCSRGLNSYVESVNKDVPVIDWSFSDSEADDDDSESESDDLALRRKLGIGKDAPVILYAGNFQEYQGVDLLMEAMPIVRKDHPAAVLVLLGASGGDRSARIERRYGGAVIVCPRQPHNVVAGHLRMAQILVSPRKWGNNLPLKVFEYLAAGKPIVATDNAHHRIVLNEERAEFCDASAEGLARAIVGLLDDPARMQRLARAAREFSETELGWARFVESVSRLYDIALRRAVN